MSANKTRTVLLTAVATSFLHFGGQAQGNVVSQWNALALDAIKASNTPPPAAARALAMMHTAMYDAVNSIDRTHVQYRSLQSAGGPASHDAAAAPPPPACSDRSSRRINPRTTACVTRPFRASWTRSLAPTGRPSGTARRVRS